jgi:alkanesulfonate monooxygenase SsuD/methylene tetrahydromethanopterin reductase-like flavin-dependent oxidoreductase (luciferase family)
MDRRKFVKLAAGTAIASAVTAMARPAKSHAQGSGAGSPSSRPGTDSSSKQSSPTATPPIMTPMMGFMLGHEQFPIPELLKLGVAAEQAGFDVLATSDHLQPWQSNEGHCGKAWITMAALGERTRRAWIGPTVTCPSFRYNPAVVAEAFASLSLLYPNRIFLGLGSGEALNEQAATGSWPKWPERSERLVEATEVIRKLWTGNQVVHRGK